MGSLLVVISLDVFFGGAMLGEAMRQASLMTHHPMLSDGIYGAHSRELGKLPKRARVFRSFI